MTFALSITFKRRLGLYGKLFDSPVGMIGFAIVMSGSSPRIFADMIIAQDPLSQVSGMKNALPGTPFKDGTEAWFLLGG